MSSKPLVLASRSPQRQAILEQLGVAFTVSPVEVEEVADGDPRSVVIENACRKARAASGERVLGVDTIVVHQGRIHGKPADADQARASIEKLSGGPHEVWSGIALVEGERERSEARSTTVTFRLLTPQEIDWYLATGEWEGRAGGYAIQGCGAALVAEIEGDHWTVVGLPVPDLVALAPDLFRA